MTANNFQVLLDAVSERQKMVKSYLFEERNRIAFIHKHLEDAVYSYINAGGKSLRPAVLMFACGAVGGDEATAVPAAAAVELYHTFTLVHDDIIDRDELRRGVPTVHHAFTQRAQTELNYDLPTATHYGMSIGILAGDMQQGWAASLLPDLYLQHNLPPALALMLVRELFRHTQITLINGETVDILQSQTPVDKLTEADVLDMLWQKTGVLYEFAGRAGAAIGLKEPDLNHPTIQALATFTGQCGIAFQLQDDVLGVVGDEKRIGKPVGSDIREGKRTVIVLKSLENMTQTQREFTLRVLGNHEASSDEVQEVIGLLQSSGGVDHAKRLAEQRVAHAVESLQVLPDTEQKQYLLNWADYIVEREL